MPAMSRRRPPCSIVRAWLLLALVGLGCSAWRATLPPDLLRRELAERVQPLPAEGIVIPHEVDAVDIDRAREILGGHATTSERTQVLFDAIFAEWAFGVRYVPIVTLPAREALARREGNCLTIAAVFVGLARGVGLDAYYIDASKRLAEVDTEEEVIVNMGHITAAVDTDRGTLAMDFGWDLPRGNHYRRLDDDEAVAHFYNNRGYERLDDAMRGDTPLDWSAAARDFTTAVQVRPDFARGWNNLGIAHARQGELAVARHDYDRAIELDRRFVAPRMNIGVLALRSGRFDEALTAFDAAAQIEPRNASAQFHRGVALLRMDRRAEAIGALTRAVALEPGFTRAQHLLERAQSEVGTDGAAPSDGARAR